MPVVENTKSENAETIVSPGSCQVTVITTQNIHGNTIRFPELTGLRHSYGSSRNQQLEDDRRKDGSEWRHRNLVLSPCESDC